MSMRVSWAVRGAAVTLLAVAGGAVAASPAIAAPTCASGGVCLYDGLNATGAKARYQYGDNNMGVGVPAFNDRMESWQNNSGRRFCWYVDAEFRGTRYVMEPYGNRIVTLRPEERNRASSLQAC
jgi:hypothetical protein